MSRILPNNRVRRRLFSDDGNQEAKLENFANVLQESIAAERLEKSAKWNFDFENEVPLEGKYEWVSCATNNNDWIGKTQVDDDVSLQEENEATPKSKEEVVMPAVRKRTIDEINGHLAEKQVRRKISFE